jgi:hypothetical protein
VGSRSSLKVSLLIVIGVSASLGTCTPAHAYVDPNAGGLLFQLLTPIIALITASLTFARRQLLRVWVALLGGMKALVARLFRA